MYRLHILCLYSAVCVRQLFMRHLFFFREAVYGRQRTDVQWMPVCHKLSYANIAQRSCSFLKNETVNLTVYCRKLVCTTLLIRQAKMIF